MFYFYYPPCRMICELNKLTEECEKGQHKYTGISEHKKLNI